MPMPKLPNQNTRYFGLKDRHTHTKFIHLVLIFHTITILTCGLGSVVTLSCHNRAESRKELYLSALYFNNHEDFKNETLNFKVT